MPRQDRKVQKLKRHLRSNDVATELESMESNQRMPVKQAKQCSKQSQRMPANY
jgi:hypothetical protein